MKLPPEDVTRFYKLYLSLLVYMNTNLSLVSSISSPGDLKNVPPKGINKLRNVLYDQPEAIQSFVRENPFNFSPSELKIVSGWTNFVKGKFIVFRYLKDHTIFLSTDEPPRAYGVLALNSSFQEMIGSSLPVMVEAVLLPFEGRIIYDSIFSPYRVSFGKGIRQSFSDAYQEAKSRFGIITSLPFTADKLEQTDADKLRYYLRNERNRTRYRQEIAHLISTDSELLALYHQEMGKVHARTYRKRLREIGLTKAWFAILEGTIIASGITRDEVEQVVERILPPEKTRFVYIFRLG